MTRGTIGLFLLILGCVVPFRRADSAVTEEVPWKLNAQAAQRLAAEAWGQGQKPRDFDWDAEAGRLIDREDGHPMGRFFYFTGIPPAGSNGFFAHLAVNPWTGEVWNLAGCYKLSTPDSHSTQIEIRKLFTPEELTRYDELSQIKPFCILDDVEEE